MQKKKIPELSAIAKIKKTKCSISRAIGDMPVEAEEARFAI